MKELILLLFLYLANADVCQLRLILNDAGNDGWEDNYVTGTADGVAIDFQPVDGSVDVTDGHATLLEKDVGSFKFQIPSGASVTINYFGDSTQYAYENSWVLELWDIYNPFGSVILSKSGAVLVDGKPKPIADPTGPVICGPRPVPVTNLTVAATATKSVSAITWTKDPSHDDQTVFSVTYSRDTDPGTYIYLGVTADASLRAVLPTGIKISVNVEALNKYGPSTTVTSESFLTSDYKSGRIFLRLFDSDGLGWGVNDGGVAVYLKQQDAGLQFDAILGIVTFECATEGGCYSKDTALDVPSGVSWTFKTKFIRPTKGVEDCSYSVYRVDGAVLFESGQDANGPVNPDGTTTVYFDDGCLTADPWGTCTALDGNCGAGKQTRNHYESVSDNECIIKVETQNCTVPCPVACVGLWSDYSTCVPNCGVGYKTRNYTVTAPALFGGADCPFSHGYRETTQCDDNPACPQNAQICQYRFTAYDYEQDGWGDSTAEISAGGTVVRTITLNASTDDSFDNSKKQFSFTAPKGSNVTIKWNPVSTDGHDPQSAAFSITQVVGDNIVQGGDVLQNPAGLNMSVAPQLESSFVANCVDCSGASKQFCSDLHRTQCEFAQAADNTCGTCADGYTSDTAGPGNTACTDVDECLINPCLLKNAQCANIPGSFICYCTDPQVPTTDICEVPATTATSFVEMQVVAKIKQSNLNGLPTNTKSCPGIITRKEWSEMSTLEKTTWKNAIRAMYDVNVPQTLDTPNADGTPQIYNLKFWQWTRKLHMLATPNVHGNPYFLPWHRQFLDDVEGYIRTKTDSCIFLPFYDGTRILTYGSSARTDLFQDAYLCPLDTEYILNTQSTCQLNGIPDCDPVFENEAGCIEGTWSDGSPMHAQVWRDKGPDGWIPTAATIYGLLRYTTYDSFNTDLEANHGYFHAYVGGHMGGLWTAAGDPTFFMWHAAVDAWWNYFQACNGGLATQNAANPRIWTPNAAYGYNDPMPLMHGVPPSAVYNVLNLGYRYSYEFINHVRYYNANVQSLSGGSTWCAITSSNSQWFDTLSNPPATTVAPTVAPTTAPTTARPTAAPTTPPPTNPPATTARPTNPPPTNPPPTNPPPTNPPPTNPPPTNPPPTNPPPTNPPPTNPPPTNPPPTNPPPTNPPPTNPPPTNPPPTTARPTATPNPNYPAAWYNVTLTTPSFGSYIKEVYDGKGWLWVPYGLARTVVTTEAYYVMNTPYYNFHGPIQLKPSLLETGTRILGVEAPYTAYRGFYKKPNADTNKTDLYSAHGCHKKTKGHKKGGRDKGAKNSKKLNEAYKDEYEKSGNDTLALEAMFRMECTLASHEKETLWTPALIKSMMMEKVCAAGGCHDPCYRITKGKNAKRRNKKYLKKHGGKYPKSYTASLNATEGSVPQAVLLEQFSFDEISIPQPRSQKLRQLSHQQMINPPQQ